MTDSLVSIIFLVFFGASILATLALFTRQSTLVAYIILGACIGPWGFKLLKDVTMVREIGDVGIIFLLFLLGLHLPLTKLAHMMRKVASVGVVSSLIFLVTGAFIAWCVHYTYWECLVIGAAMMFSSTIIGIKLLPTTILHHQHTGEVMIGVLLFQDIIAIVVLLAMHGASGESSTLTTILATVAGLPVMVIAAYLAQRWVLIPLFVRFNRMREYMFLLAIGWCLCMAQLASWFGLSAEIGAFIAGVSLASSPVSVYIAESLKPIRDFFLVMFFFSVGASFNLTYVPVVIVPAVILAALLMLIKPYAYRSLLQWVGEKKTVSWEVGVRLAQVSEFSLIIAYMGLDTFMISKSAAYLIEATTILTFIVSSYWVVLKFPTPVSMSEGLRRD